MSKRATRRATSALAGLVLAVALGCGGEAEVDNSALRERMQYLANLAEVDWLDFEGGNVYVGFAERPPDLASIVNSAAAVASKAHGRKVHIWAVDGGAPGWRPGDGPVMCEASVRMGMPEKTCL